MPREISLSEVRNIVGTEVGLSDWIMVDQTMINAFADATGVPSSFMSSGARQGDALRRHDRPWFPDLVAIVGDELQLSAEDP